MFPQGAMKPFFSGLHLQPLRLCNERGAKCEPFDLQMNGHLSLHDVGTGLLGGKKMSEALFCVSF